MYELPPDEDLVPLLGSKLVLISFSANQVIFQFDEHTSLVAEAAFTLADDAGHEELVEIPPSTISVLALLESEIVDVNVTDARRRLVLRFSNGRVVRFVSDKKFESFHLKLDGKEFIV
jgi:hypothetical protein